MRTPVDMIEGCVEMFGVTQEPMGKRAFLLPSGEFLDLKGEPHNIIMKCLKDDEFLWGSEVTAIKSFIIATGAARWRIEGRELIIEISTRFPLSSQQSRKISKYVKTLDSIQWIILDKDGDLCSFKRGYSSTDFFREFERCRVKNNGSGVR